MANAPPPGGNLPPAPPPQNVAIPLQVWSQHFNQLHMELRTKNALDAIRKFDGEGQQAFSSWLRDMEKARLTTQGDDAQMKRLAALTLVGPASEFAIRTSRENPLMTWAEFKRALKERYSNLADEQFARQVLKRLRQGAAEGVQNFAERILIAAEEAHAGADLTAPVIQQNLVEIFVDGITSKYVARKLIKLKPATLADAVRVATGEDLASKAFELRRGEEDMEIDLLGAVASPPSSNMAALMATVGQLTEQVSKLTTMVAKSQSVRPRKGRAGNFRFTTEGKPICAACDQVGHIRTNCPSKGKN